jgi:hypothetical protein
MLDFGAVEAYQLPIFRKAAKQQTAPSIYNLT